MNKVEAEYEYTVELARLAGSRYLRRNGRTTAAILVTLVAIGAIRAFDGEWDVLTFSFFAAPFFVFLAWSFYFRRARNVARDLADPHMTLIADEEGITFRAVDASSTFAWTRIREVWKFDDVWLFFPYGPGGGSFTAVPTAAFGEAVRAFIAEKLTQSGARVISASQK